MTPLSDNALINSEVIRKQLGNIESEIVRGINVVYILDIIRSYEAAGTYGYQILKDISEKTQKQTFIEEGTLYPLLKKMERDKILRSENKKSGNQTRKYYYVTEYGEIYHDYTKGLLTQIFDILSPTLDIKIESIHHDFIFCENCGNKIMIKEDNLRFCMICGYFIEGKIKDALLKRTKQHQKLKNPNNQV